MLLSLISVLVLLVIGFYALWIAASGRVSGPESPELHLAGRGLVAVLGVVALGAAFAIYRLPSTQAGWASRAPAPVAVPETRGRTAAESEAAMAQAVKDDAADAAAEKSDGKAAEAADDEASLSSAAALKESEVRLPQGKAVASAESPVSSDSAAPAKAQPVVSRVSTAPVAPVAPAVVAPTKAPVVAATAKPVVSKAASNPPAERVRRRSRAAHGPLTLHVQNRLGRDQQYEQLTLSIEGLAVADFGIDTQQPAISVAVPLPRPGLLHYRLEGFSDGRESRQLVGEGCIRVRDGARFNVRRQPGSQRVFLEVARAG